MPVHTNVPGVYPDWGAPPARLVSGAGADMFDPMQFLPVKMGPKLEAANAFAAATGKPASIGRLEDAALIAQELTGTIHSAPPGRIERHQCRCAPSPRFLCQWEEGRRPLFGSHRDRLGKVTMTDVTARTGAGNLDRPLAAEEPVFVARGLTKIYGLGDAQVIALSNVDLSIRQGEFLVLLGPSGSGKSTLLNILGGLDAPTSGRAAWRDHELTGASDAELTRYRREHVGFVFQFYNLIPNLTVRENVELVAEIAADAMPAEEALALVGLSGRLDHFPSQLSGGEQQRVAVARAIVKRPDILLCDEPTGALDAETGRLVLAAIAKVNAELGTTTVVITHNSAISGMADRVLRLSGGRIAGEQWNPHRLSAEEVTW